MKKTFPLILLSGVLVGVGFLSGCIFDRNNVKPAQEETPSSPTPAPAPTPEEPSQNDTGESTSTSNVKEFSINARQWEFSPSSISVKKGDRVKLTITSFDVPHGFALPEYNIDELLAPGVTKTVEFTADKAGSFGFFCNVFCGSGHTNMKGMLIVSE